MARDFDGNTANHITPQSINPNFPCVGAFIQLDSLLATNMAIAGKWSAGTNQLSFLLEVLTTGKLSYAVDVPPLFQQIGATTLSVGVRYHVFGYYNGFDLRVYLDGVLDGSSTPGSGFTVNTGGLYEIGYRSSGPRSFDGGIAEVAVWDRPRDPLEIAAMAAGVSAARYPRDLLTFCPLWGEDSPEADLSRAGSPGATIVGTVPKRDTPEHAGQPWGVYG